ncbi:hypothetical protein NQ315_006604 [Exocentrus adspersus]|uniref:Nuclease HARBI1 n=1 Tax=Exocentrus adspersus TaxID=1586481 RepID=A0AAV8VGL2_9CUCU|nr:hypothetical protein NQ315_006604 [Exocentrus adspersus]
MEGFNEILVWNNIINNDVIQAEEEMVIGRDVLIQSDPMQLSDHKFVQLFRVDKDLCRDIVDTVRPYIEDPSRTSGLSIQTKVLAALRFYATGSHQEITGSNHFVAISQASTSRAIKEVTNALNRPEARGVPLHKYVKIFKFLKLR